MKEKLNEKRKDVEIEAINEWIEINNGWLGKNKFEIENAIIENKETNGTAWESLIKTTNEEEALEMLRRMDISSKRHSATDYD